MKKRFLKMMSQAKTICTDTCGVALVEFAIILPVLLLFMLAVMEFGWYFVRDEAVSRALSNVSAVLIQNPANLSQASANVSGSSLIPFGADGNYICAKSYLTLTEAQNGGCAAGDWSTGIPAGGSSTSPYYIILTVHAAPSTFTPLTVSVIPKSTALNQATIVTVTSGSISPPVSMAGTYVTSGSLWNGTCKTTYSNPFTSTGGVALCTCPTGYAAYPSYGRDGPTTMQFVCYPCGTDPAHEKHCF